MAKVKVHDCNSNGILHHMKPFLNCERLDEVSEKKPPRRLEIDDSLQK